MFDKNKRWNTVEWIICEMFYFDVGLLVLIYKVFKVYALILQTQNCLNSIINIWLNSVIIVIFIKISTFSTETNNNVWWNKNFFQI